MSNLSEMFMQDVSNTADTGINPHGWADQTAEQSSSNDVGNVDTTINDVNQNGWADAQTSTSTDTSNNDVVAIAEWSDNWSDNWSDGSNADGNNKSDTENTTQEDKSSKPSWDKELDAIMEELGISTDKASSQSEDVKKAAEDIQSDVKKDDKITEELKSKVDDLVLKTAELETTNATLDKTNEVLRKEYDRVTEENIALKYWNSSWSKIMDVVNNNDNLKTLIANNVLYNKNNDASSKEKLIDAVKSYYEELTGIDIGSVVNKQKDLETSSMSSNTDSAFGWWSSDSMFL